MSAEILRRAAALMRERAEAVNYPSPWSIGGGTCEIRSNGGRNYVASTYGGVGTEEAAAQHIASWHPAVALAVADLLDGMAARAEEMAGTIGSPRVAEATVTANITGYSAALAVARAYLKDQS